jgi:hypothetical protein
MAMTDDLRALIERVKYLLEWMPICSIGSSGHKRRLAVEESLAKFAEDGSLNQAVSVKADLEHPAQAIQGAKSATDLRAIAEQLHSDDWWWEHSNVDNLERAMRLAIDKCIQVAQIPPDAQPAFKRAVEAELLKEESKK